MFGSFRLRSLTVLGAWFWLTYSSAADAAVANRTGPSVAEANAVPPPGRSSPFSPEPWARTNPPSAEIPLPDLLDDVPNSEAIEPEVDDGDVQSEPAGESSASSAGSDEQASSPRAKKKRSSGRAKRSKSSKSKSRARSKSKSSKRSKSTARSDASRESVSDDEPADLSRSSAPNDTACHYQSPLHEHEVLPGEHLGQIAGRYGVNRSELVALNDDLANPNHIRPGQTIKVCPAIAPRELLHRPYTVVSGDNMRSIAAAHDVTVRELLSFQRGKIDDPNRIRVGQELDIWVQGDVVAAFRPRKRSRSTRGKLRSGQRLAAADHYHLRRPHNAYGTPRTVSLLSRVFGRYNKKSRGGPRLLVGDLSKKGGGPLKGHASHQRGTDVDIGLVLKGPQTQVKRFVTGSSSNLDVARTWLLVHEFLKTGEVRYIFLDYKLQKLLYEHAKKRGVPESRLDEYFQYPRSIRRSHGIVRHWRGHKDHIHVRFRE